MARQKSIRRRDAEDGLELRGVIETREQKVPCPREKQKRRRGGMPMKTDEENAVMHESPSAGM
jgi:hypothetical protein